MVRGGGALANLDDIETASASSSIFYLRFKFDKKEHLTTMGRLKNSERMLVFCTQMKVFYRFNPVFWNGTQGQVFFFHHTVLQVQPTPHYIYNTVYTVQYYKHRCFVIITDE